MLRLRRTRRLPSPVALPGLAAGPGRLLAAGGLDADGASTPDVLRVVPARARRVARLPVAVHDAAAAHVGGADYVFGGGTADGPSDAVLRMGPGPTATRVGRLPAGASDISAATIGRTAYLAGGDAPAGALNTIVAFTPGRGAHVVGRLPRPLRYAAVDADDGAVIIAGGTTGLRRPPRGAALRPVVAPRATDRTTARPDHPRRRGDARRPVYVLGGRGGAPRLRARRDPVHRPHHRPGAAAPDACPARCRTCRAATVGGRIVVVGGATRQGRARDEVWWLDSLVHHGDPRSSAAARIAGVYAHATARTSARPSAGTARVYVPDTEADRVDVISQRTGQVIRRIPVGRQPQHVTPSVGPANPVGQQRPRQLADADRPAHRPCRPAGVPVTDPYNLYFTPDGHRAIVVAEARRELDFRTPHTMRLRHALKVPQCKGVDHMDDTADGRYALVSCEFAGRMIVVDLPHERVVRTIRLRDGAMPQDVKLSPDGHTFYVADMASNGVWLIDARSWRLLRLQPTGKGAHGLYPSRDSRRLYVSNRDEGSISVISFATRRPIAKWRLPGRASPDMGGVSADGRVLWLTGRYDSEVYAISTGTGRLLRRIPVGAGPHGAAVWPQPGRYSIGHTGILR